MRIRVRASHRTHWSPLGSWRLAAIGLSLSRLVFLHRVSVDGCLERCLTSVSLLCRGNRQWRYQTLKSKTKVTLFIAAIEQNISHARNQTHFFLPRSLHPDPVLLQPLNISTLDKDRNFTHYQLVMQAGTARRTQPRGSRRLRGLEFTSLRNLLVVPVERSNRSGISSRCSKHFTATATNTPCLVIQYSTLLLLAMC